MFNCSSYSLFQYLDFLGAVLKVGESPPGDVNSGSRPSQLQSDPWFFVGQFSKPPTVQWSILMETWKHGNQESQFSTSSDTPGRPCYQANFSLKWRTHVLWKAIFIEDSCSDCWKDHFSNQSTFKPLTVSNVISETNVTLWFIRIQNIIENIVSSTGFLHHFANCFNLSVHSKLLIWFNKQVMKLLSDIQKMGPFKTNMSP